MLQSNLAVTGLIALMGLLVTVGVLWKAAKLEAERVQALQARLALYVQQEQELHSQRIENARLAARLEEHHTCHAVQAQLESEVRRLNECLHRAQLQHQAQQVVAEEKLRSAQEKEAWLQIQEGKLEESFQSAASRCLEQVSTRSLTQHEQRLSQTLGPLQERLKDFQGAIEGHFTDESKERHVLAHELQRLQSLNSQLSEEAIRLTQALRGDQKIQGNWGEMLLERALEASGLREGSEFKLQVSLPGPTEGQRLQPDAVVYLPKGRSIIVDAKVSLTAYERYCRCEADKDRKAALQAHVQSVRAHIRRLSHKQYTQSPALQTLDYVLLFMPVEPAFSLALQEAPDLLQEAQSQQVLLVGPSTLLVSLRTIQYLWKIEKQALHARNIAKKAGALYDKFRLLLESFESMGQALDRAKEEYFQVMNRLCSGKGNVLRQIEGLQQLGAESRKKLSSRWTQWLQEGEGDSEEGPAADLESLTGETEFPIIGEIPPGAG